MRAAVTAVTLFAVLTALGCRTGASLDAAPEWPTVFTPDSALTLEVPRAYQERNAYGCWNRNDGHWPSAADFCLSLASAEEAELRLASWRLPCPGSSQADASCFEERREDTIVVGGQRALVVRALLSGTIGHYRRLPAVLILIPYGPAGSAIFQGDHREPETYIELVAIAGSIRLVQAPHE